MAKIQTLKNCKDIPYLYNIDYPVGKNCINRYDDVALIQYFLKTIPQNGLALVSFARPDPIGKFGKHTLDLMNGFIDKLTRKDLYINLKSFNRFEPIKDLDSIYSTEKNENLMVRLNRWVFRNSPINFAADSAINSAPFIKIPENIY